MSVTLLGRPYEKIRKRRYQHSWQFKKKRESTRTGVTWYQSRVNLDTRWRWLVNSMPRSLFSGHRCPSYIEWEAGWLPELVWHFGEEKNPLRFSKRQGTFDQIGNYCVLKINLSGWYAKFIIVTILLNIRNHVLRTALRCSQHAMVVPSFIVRGMKRLQHNARIRPALSSSISPDKYRIHTTQNSLLPNSCLRIICPHY